MPEHSLPANATDERAIFDAECVSDSRAVPISQTARITCPTPTRRSLAVGVWSALLVAGIVLIARRLSGEWVLAPHPSLAVTSLMAVAVASHLAWLGFQSDSRRSFSGERNRWIPVGVSLTVSILWCLTLLSQSVPLTAGVLVGVILFQAMAVFTTASIERRFDRSSDQRPDFAETPLPIAISRTSRPYTAVANSTEVESRGQVIEPARIDPARLELAATEFEPLDSVDSAASEDITQWMSRRVTDDAEVVEGWMRVTFAVGQREVTIHVSFCPPLTGSPEIETEDLEGADLEIRVASAFPFGLRITARRSGSMHEVQAARIGFVALATAARRAA